MNFDLPIEMDCYAHVWFAVLVQAVEDATIEIPPPTIHKHGPLCKNRCKRLAFTEEHYFQRTAMNWFLHNRHDIGSFQWVCSILNLEPEKIIEQVRQRKTANRNGVRTRRVSRA